MRDPGADVDPDPGADRHPVADAEPHSVPASDALVQQRGTTKKKATLAGGLLRFSFGGGAQRVACFATARASRAFLRAALFG